jgi:hypothetical protein
MRSEKSLHNNLGSATGKLSKYALAVAICSNVLAPNGSSFKNLPQSSLVQPRGVIRAGQTVASKESGITFRPDNICDFFDSVDQRILGCTGYRASNGEAILVYSRTFATPSDLSNYLQEKLKNAKKIIEREQKSDEKGNKIGERIVGVLELKYIFEPAPKTYTVLIRTRGNTYTEYSDVVSKQSLRTILAFEKYLEQTK